MDHLVIFYQSWQSLLSSDQTLSSLFLYVFYTKLKYKFWNADVIIILATNFFTILDKGSLLKVTKL